MEVLIDKVIEYLNHFPVWSMYLFFFISGALQIIFVPYPGDSILILGGYLGSRGLYGGFLPIFFSYWLATVVFSFILFELGYWRGENVLNNRLVLKYFSFEDQNRAKRFIIKYGGFVYIVSKFIPGIGFLVLLITGILRYKRSWAYQGIVYSSFLHNLFLYWVGRKVGDNWNDISNFLSTYNKLLAGVFGIVLLSYVALKLVRHRQY